MWGPGCDPVSGVFAKELQSLLLELMTIFRNICHVVVITSGAAPMEDGVHAPFLCKSLPLDEFSVLSLPPHRAGLANGGVGSLVCLSITRSSSQFKRCPTGTGC
jgi:hypothetical protein